MTTRLCVCGHPFDFPYHHPTPDHSTHDSTCAGCECRNRRLADDMTEHVRNIHRDAAAGYGYD